MDLLWNQNLTRQLTENWLAPRKMDLLWHQNPAGKLIEKWPPPEIQLKITWKIRPAGRKTDWKLARPRNCNWTSTQNWVEIDSPAETWLGICSANKFPIHFRPANQCWAKFQVMSSLFSGASQCSVNLFRPLFDFRTKSFLASRRLKAFGNSTRILVMLG